VEMKRGEEDQKGEKLTAEERENTREG